MGLPRPASTSSARPSRRMAFRLPPIVLAILLVIFYLQFSYIPSYLFKVPDSVAKLSESHLNALEEGLRKCDEAYTLPIDYAFPASTRSNPRWNSKSGQKQSILIKNATLFDGKDFVADPVDILLEEGVIRSVVSASESAFKGLKNVSVHEANLKYVTPGIVDMHSHHLVHEWPMLDSTTDGNEVHPDFGPLTPFVRALDGMKAYDEATALIASGGVTSSLILPGSANIMGGEAVPVKNILRGGEHGEEVVEELLLEHGIPKNERRRYLKMACGENPRRVYDHTRMGNAWKLREQMAKGRDLMQQQDAWCLSAAAARDTGDMAAISSLVRSTAGDKGGFPEELKLDSTVAMLRSKININIHCYEQEDFEDMLLHSQEFGFRVAAFHHALEAWKVPEMIKASGQNITIATFQDFSLYKHEAYDANLYAGKILADHGVPVAFKSDHAAEETSAKYLLFQAASANSFGLSAELALQSVTSVPATSMQQDHRIGYVRPGYDADLVIWDSYPLSTGATPLQVYIDGKATLDSEKAADSLARKSLREVSTQHQQPAIRPMIAPEERELVCQNAVNANSRVVINGISKSYLTGAASASSKSSSDEKLTMILDNGSISCFGTDCAREAADDSVVIDLKDGNVLPGLTAFSSSLGLSEIAMEDATSDGDVSGKIDPLKPENVVYAKHGIHLEGKAFKRAQIGGVTRAITAPQGGLESSAFLLGVSTGLKTSENKTILDGGVFQDDVALHFVIGQGAKGAGDISTVSASIEKLRRILSENKATDTVYGKACNGTLPVVVHADNKYDLMQLIKVKSDYPTVNLVILGGHEAWAVAEELATAKIPLIFTAFLGAYDSWEKKDTLPGPPLSKSPAEIFVDAGLMFGLAINGESAPIGDAQIHNLALHASWAAKYAGLSDEEAVDLVSRNIETILGLEGSKDLVIYEGNPLEFGASVVLTVDGDDGIVVNCWPQAH